MSDANAAAEISYDLDDSYAMGLSYLAAVLIGEDSEIELIEDQMDPVELTGSLLQLNIVLLSKVLRLLPESDGIDGVGYLERLRAEHAAKGLGS